MNTDEIKVLGVFALVCVGLGAIFPKTQKEQAPEYTLDGVPRKHSANRLGIYLFYQLEAFGTLLNNPDNQPR